MADLYKELGNLIVETIDGEWKTMEKKWNDALSEGKKVEVDIKINYADNLRPTDFDVTYIIKTSDGKIEKTENLFFLN